LFQDVPGGLLDVETHVACHDICAPCAYRGLQMHAPLEAMMVYTRFSVASRAWPPIIWHERRGWAWRSPFCPFCPFADISFSGTLMSSSPSATATAHTFNKILREPKSSSRSRGTSDSDDGTKKLRRLILIEGIPSAAVGSLPSWSRHPCHDDDAKHRIQHCVHGYGRYCLACLSCP
jgi:hypothetical protein